MAFHALGSARAARRASARRGLPADAFRWCRDVTLVPDVVELHDDWRGDATWRPRGRA